MILVFKHDKGLSIQRVRTQRDALFTINWWLQTSYKTFAEMTAGTVEDPVWIYDNVKDCLDGFRGTFTSVDEYDDFIKELTCAL